MAKAAPAQTAPQTTAEYEAEFELLMQEAARISKQLTPKGGSLATDPKAATLGQFTVARTQNASWPKT